VHIYHFVLTGTSRKAAKVAYPAAYADSAVAAKDPAAFRFNCAQRAQTNFGENLVPFLVDLAVAGLRFPRAAAGLGLLWSVSRVVYAWGYANVGPDARHT
jgi:glutathione S-transferase